MKLELEQSEIDHIQFALSSRMATKFDLGEMEAARIFAQMILKIESQTCQE